MIDATELRLLRIAYHRAHGAPDMPSPRFIDELAHELKDRFASDADLWNESELFYEYQGRTNRSARELDAHVITTNDATVCANPGTTVDRSPLTANVCRKIELIQGDLTEIRSGWSHVGSRRDVPKDACYVGRSGDCYTWVCPGGIDGLTEFT